ncbi:MAG TPA: dephospho-CoA kinase [Pyrinomonadaceae bacterium]|jgi:dephospho-CoA kinase
MLKVGLTGSIAVGKTFVTEVFRELGCFVSDADRTAREVVSPGTIGWRQIVENFGASVLASDGQIDRATLGAIVFADEEKRLLLNSIVHPLVFDRQNEWLAQIEAENPQAIAIIDAALMIESGGYKRFDKIIIIWCQPEIQIERLMKRNNFSRAEAEQRIAAQMSQEEKKRYADFLIDTSDGFDEARRQTEAIFKKLAALAN